MPVTPQELAASRARLYDVDPEEDIESDDDDGPQSDYERQRLAKLDKLIRKHARTNHV